ncbi:Transmembrane emp24 domain-containing protein eca [Orchesella cincta]|uniref:Transmembrane emp24 domain-containing protein eca n=1 Tax=Orchesella cincta TaxID=48709 RepID=A0A1D2MHG5_ORCCI|nr:Transmembrane emp24 domain-containing protein eca [Orchesella cincta]
MRSSEVLFGVVVFSLALSTVNSLYFHIGETEKKCFREEIPDDTTVIGIYKVQLFDSRTGGFMTSSPQIGMHVVVTDPDEETIMSKAYSSEGRFTFTSHTPGEHIICLYSNSTKWFTEARLRVHLNFQVGEETIDYKAVAQRDKLTVLQIRFRHLLDQLAQISGEQRYQRYREERFRETSENTSQRILWWSFVQMGTLLGVGCWQVKHLRSFFEYKKLV